MSFLIEAIASALINSLLNPLMRQVSYVLRVGESVKSLDTAMAGLKERSDDLMARIAASQERDPAQQPTSEVEGLLQRVRQIETEVTAIRAMYERSCKSMGGCSGNIYSSYMIGRKATKQNAMVQELYEKVGASVDAVTRPRPSPPGQQMPGTSKLLAMESNLNEVLSLLANAFVANDKGLTVGIWGMGGVGKTTLLKAINNKLSTGGVHGVHFDRVIWVVASKHAKVRKVQADIANLLKLQLPNGGADERTCHDAIFNFLKEKKFVILLDDVWERLDLDGIGIPDHRVVIFTTRSEAVCGDMDAHSIVKVECLQEDEAWRLFKAKVGDMSSNPEIQKLAKAVAKECKGLPLALMVIGRAMASKHTREEWQHTLTSLINSQPGPGTSSSLQEPLFHTLKYSYDSLPDETTRLCFLLCALYPEDTELDPDELIDLFLGHDLIDVGGCDNVGEIFDRGYDRIIGVLKSTCLLVSDDESSLPRGLKMHDVLRDMALWIARDCGGSATKWVVRAGLNRRMPLKGVKDWEMAEKLSLEGNDMTNLPMPRRRGEKLSTLILMKNSKLKSIRKGFFTHFPALSYLDLSFTQIRELPDEVNSLSGLQCLDLSSTSIEALNDSLRNLRKLRHLRLSLCQHLNYIPHGLISHLPMLQFLDIYGGAYIFKSEDSIGEKDGDGSTSHIPDDNKVVQSKANLAELKALKKRQQIKSLGLNLEMRTIRDLRKVVDVACISRLKLIALQDSKPKVVTEAILMAAHSIKALELSDCRMLKELILTNVHLKGEAGLLNGCFRRLYSLELVNLSGLIKVTWTKRTLLEMFPRLTNVTIDSCHELQNLTWTGHLPCLRHLYVINCNGLKEIINIDENGEDPPRLISSIFPQLQNLQLQHLVELQRISDGVLASPKLNFLAVEGCLGLKRLSFSFQPQITKKIKFSIRCEKAWWEGLEWEDENMKSYLQTFVEYLEKYT